MSSKVLSGADAARCPMLEWPRAAAPRLPALAGPLAGSSAPPSPGPDELHRAAEQGRAAGRAEAEAQARGDAAAEVAAIQQRSAESIARFAGERAAHCRRLEQDLVTLSLAIARRILRRELTVDPDAISGIARAAIEKLDARELVRLRVSARDAAALDRALRALPLPARVELTPDPALEPGALLLETTRGVVDASVDTQLAEIERGFTDLLRRHRA